MRQSLLFGFLLVVVCLPISAKDYASDESLVPPPPPPSEGRRTNCVFPPPVSNGPVNQSLFRHPTLAELDSGWLEKARKQLDFRLSAEGSESRAFSCHFNVGTDGTMSGPVMFAQNFSRVEMTTIEGLLASLSSIGPLPGKSVRGLDVVVKNSRVVKIQFSR